MVHGLIENNFDRHIQMCKITINILSSVILKKVLWCHDATLTLSAHINSHSYVYWDSTKPNRMIEN